MEVVKMAMIEPINSAMTYQAQQVQPVKTSADTQVLNTDVKTQDNSVAFDPTTVKIQEVQEQDSNSTSSNSNESMYDKQREVSTEQMKKAVENINKNMSNSEAVFGFHDETNRVTIKIVDKDTKEVIKELPPEKTLDMIAKAWELAGLLVDEKR